MTITANILTTDDNRFYRCTVNSVRGVPVIIEISVRIFLQLEKEEIYAFKNYYTVKKYWENLIMKLSFYTHIQKHVTKERQVKGEIYNQHIIGLEKVLDHEIRVTTIEYHEQSPLIQKIIPKKSSPELGNVAVMCSENVDRRGYQEIDATLGKIYY
ncbi:hypothetical protein RCL_jg5996.t2 [Rhizophagus clarus]|uniref:Uncharacterized protein n=1 Tax=Rhizophagus clarus TaxID=94130 RepID=A0A8H3QWC9_9GLOM|nr:hypothetical protein RCL_jg5996.t2 [Rhizophagus clarus]